jgi:CRP/FNR family transcriptional regulator
MSTSHWIENFPALASLGDEARGALMRAGRVIELPARRTIFGPGQAPESFILLLDGTVRVHQVAESGREIVLYRVVAGESCPLTTACLMGYEDYAAEAVTETDIRAVAIPRATFDDLVATSAEFRRFVFTAFSRRVTNLFRVIEEVAFQRLDLRLAAKLLERAGEGAELTLTHQELAAELGTAREVVSRHLNELQRRGWIAAGRGRIEILNRAALQTLAAA